MSGRAWGLGANMTKKVEISFTGSVVLSLVSELIDRNWEEAKGLALILANEHGVGSTAERIFAVNPER
jgi:hypothetical protein